MNRQQRRQSERQRRLHGRKRLQVAKERTIVVPWDEIKRKLNHGVTEDGEWGGAPMPIDHLRLVVEPRYPHQGLHGMKLDRDSETPPVPDGATYINHWHTLGGIVMVFREEGKIGHLIWPIQRERNEHMMNTMVVAGNGVWSIENEMRAMETLSGLIKPHLFRMYFTAGMFLETSPRSKVTYLFRKLRPTVAMASKGDQMRVLTTLCLHPIGYYEDSFAGVMTPTDDVIAHLMLMRGDEHQFWKKANHHAAFVANAGI